MSTVKHETALRRAGNHHQAWCRCGWQGTPQDQPGVALTEADRHAATSRHVGMFQTVTEDMADLLRRERSWPWHDPLIGPEQDHLTPSGYDPRPQYEAGLRYIEQRYGRPTI